jgi:AraC family transcriptional regulator
MNTLPLLDASEASCEPLPAAISTLIEGAVAAFDADRDTSRRYLLRASALLRAKWVAPAARQRDGERRPGGGFAAWQLNRVVDHIETHLTEKLTGSELAQLIDVSVGQLFRAFKVSVGVPPFHYIARRRVELACRIMRTTDEPLSQVAIACGLCDQSHFCRVFRRATGLSPAAWRRANAIDPGIGSERRIAACNVDASCGRKGQYPRPRERQSGASHLPAHIAPSLSRVAG